MSLKQIDLQNNTNQCSQHSNSLLLQNRQFSSQAPFPQKLQKPYNKPVTLKKKIFKKQERKKKMAGKLGFYSPSLGTFFECENEEEYYYIKRYLMKGQIERSKGILRSFCYKKGKRQDVVGIIRDEGMKLNDEEYYDMNSSNEEVEHIQLL